MILNPTYGPKEVLYLLEVEHYINGVMRWSSAKPPLYPNRKLKKQLTTYFSKFIFTNSLSVPSSHSLKELIFNDPLDCLRAIVNKNPELNLDRFFKTVVEEFKPELPEEYSQIGEMHFKVTYLQIREPIISYIEQKVGKSKELEELKKLFSSQSNLSFDEYLEEKSKYLLNLDLDKEFADSLNRDTERKRKQKLNKTQEVEK